MAQWINTESSEAVVLWHHAGKPTMYTFFLRMPATISIWPGCTAAIMLPCIWSPSLATHEIAATEPIKAISHSHDHGNHHVHIRRHGSDAQLERFGVLHVGVNGLICLLCIKHAVCMKDAVQVRLHGRCGYPATNSQNLPESPGPESSGISRIASPSRPVILLTQWAVFNPHRDLWVGIFRLKSQ